MALGIKDYRTLITLGDFKLKIYRSVKNRQVLLNTCVETIKYLKECDSDNYHFKDVLGESLESVERLHTYLKDEGNAIKGPEFTFLITCTLDTYFAALDLDGSEVDKVSWMETMISKFIDLFGEVQLQNDEEFKYLVGQLKDDIENTYNESFTEEMKRRVSNYKQFLNLLQKLGIVEPQTNQLAKSNIFGNK